MLFIFFRLNCILLARQFLSQDSSRSKCVDKYLWSLNSFSSWCIFVYWVCTWVCCLWFGVYEVPDYARSAEVLSTPLSTHTFSPPLFLSRFVHLTSNKGHFLFSNPVVCSVCGLRFCLRVWVFPSCVYMCKYAFGNSDCESQQWRHRF